MPYTFLRAQPFTEVVGADAEKIFGVGGVVGERLQIVAAAGTNTIPGANVPAGYIWVVTFATMVDATSAVTGASLLTVRAGVTNLVMTRAGVLGINLGISFSGVTVLVAGDRVAGRCDGCVAGDALIFCYGGYSMVAP